jgi:hypothetical protein
MLCIDGDNTRDLLLFNDLRNAVERSLDGAYAAAREVLSENRMRLVPTRYRPRYASSGIDHRQPPRLAMISAPMTMKAMKKLTAHGHPKPNRIVNI